MWKTMKKDMMPEREKRKGKKAERLVSCIFIILNSHLGPDLEVARGYPWNLWGGLLPKSEGDLSNHSQLNLGLPGVAASHPSTPLGEACTKGLAAN
jgi:hypothetical protein